MSKRAEPWLHILPPNYSNPTPDPVCEPPHPQPQYHPAAGFHYLGDDHRMVPRTQAGGEQSFGRMQCAQCPMVTLLVPVLWGRGVGTQEAQVRGAAGREGPGPGAPVKASRAFFWRL